MLIIKFILRANQRIPCLPAGRRPTRQKIMSRPTSSGSRPDAEHRDGLYGMPKSGTWRVNGNVKSRSKAAGCPTCSGIPLDRRDSGKRNKKRIWQVEDIETHYVCYSYGALPVLCKLNLISAAAPKGMPLALAPVR
jgi:hypothetical protein